MQRTVVDDLAVEVDDGDLFGPDPDGGDDVLVSVFLAQGYSLSEQLEPAIGADVTDHYDASLGREDGRHRVAREQRVVGSGRQGLVAFVLPCQHSAGQRKVGNQGQAFALQ